MVLRLQFQVVVEVVVAVGAKLGMEGEEGSGVDDETDAKDDRLGEDGEDSEDSKEPLLPLYIFAAASAGFLIIFGGITLAIR